MHRSLSPQSLFLANVSHELRTPLNAIIGFSQIMDKELFGPLGHEQYSIYAKDILDNATHLLGVIEDLLEASRHELGKIRLVEETINLRRSIETVIRLMGEKIRQKELKVNRDFPLVVPYLRGDSRKVRQILINLLSNAVKFTCPGGCITIRIAQEDHGDLEVSVSDDGIGIKEEDISRILEPFSQVDTSLSRKYQGLGLGLYLVKTFVDLHQGNLSVHSTPAQGTKVTIRFPKERLFIPVPA